MKNMVARNFAKRSCILSVGESGWDPLLFWLLGVCDFDSVFWSLAGFNEIYFIYQKGQKKKKKPHAKWAEMTRIDYRLKLNTYSTHLKTHIGLIFQMGHPHPMQVNPTRPA